MERDKISKIEFTPVYAKNLQNLGQSLYSLNVTRWIFIILSNIVAIGAIFRQIFLGPFETLLTFDSGVGLFSSGFLLVMMFFGYILISTPKTIGTFNFIFKLRRTADLVQDRHLKKAARSQYVRMALYMLLLLLLISIGSHIYRTLDQYYIQHWISADLARVFHDVGDYRSISGFDPGLYILALFYGITAIAEKAANYSTWKNIAKWFTLQLYETSAKNDFNNFKEMEHGATWMKYSVLLIALNSLVGNIAFNIGLYKLAKRLRVIKVPHIYRRPATSSSYSFLGSPSYSPKPAPQPRTRHTAIYRPDTAKIGLQLMPDLQNSSDPTSQPSPSPPRYCGFCGTRVRHAGAHYCSSCGEPY